MDQIQDPHEDAVKKVKTAQRNNSSLIPGAIICAGLVLAVTLYQFRISKTNATASKGDAALVRQVTEADHVLGNPTAPIKLVEYADIDSTYSKSFQLTMEQLMAEYAASGKVVWVYRHLPLIDEHFYSESHAEAAECAAKLGGPNDFWRFIDTLNARAPGSQQFNPKDYDGVVTSLGLLPESFHECLNSHIFQKKVGADFQNGLDAGAGGSPFTVLFVEGQNPVTIDGSVSYSSLKKIIDTAIAKLPKP
jgi:protein-disulfide isomerase